MRRMTNVIAALGLAFATPVSAQVTGTSDPAVARALEALPSYKPQGQVSGTISLWGHGSFKRDFMGLLIKRWFDEFQKQQPGVKLDYKMYGTASAIGALSVDAGTLAILGEEISPESAREFTRAKGYPPTMIEIANGSVDTNFFDYAHMIFVHKDNPIAKLTRAQLEEAFGAEHKCAKRNVRTWGGLGLTGSWANKPIAPYSWKTDVDFALFFRERVLCDSHRWNPAVREYMPVTQPDGTIVQHGQLILEALAKDPNGIAISNVRFANPDVRAVPLAWDAKGPYVTASNATLIDRTYPLVRIIPAYIDHAPGKPMPAAEREFLRYVLSREGQTAMVEESGYLPLSPAIAARERGKLQ